MSGDELGLGLGPSEAPSQSSRSEYRQTQAVYADRYGYHVRAIKGWIAEGRAANYPPPLDEPEKMPEWWTVVHPKRSVPGRLLIAAQGKAPSKTAPAPTAPPPPGPPPPPPSSDAPPADRTRLPKAGLGFAGALQRLREAESEAHEAYQAAKEDEDGNGLPKDPAKVEQLRRAWNDINEQLRFQEKAAAEVLSKSGEMVLKADVHRELTRIHSAIVGGVRSLLRRVKAKSGNVTLEQAMPAFDAEVDRVFSELIESQFGA